MTSILITGAGGFIGRGLVTALLNGYQTVYALTHTETQVADKVGPLVWLRGDIRDSSNFPIACDAVVHCAASIPAKSLNDEEIRDVNIDGMKSLLSWSGRAGVKQFIFLSSLSVYGSISASLVDETTVVNPVNVYGKSKLDAERLLETWVNDSSDRAAISVRLPAVVGKGSHNNYPSDTYHKLKNRLTIEVTNPDGLYNHIVHRDDLVSFVKHLLDGPTYGYECALVGSSDPTRVIDVPILLSEYLSIPAQIAIGDEVRNSPIIVLAKALKLGYVPQTVRETIRKFAADSLY